MLKRSLALMLLATVALAQQSLPDAPVTQPEKKVGFWGGWERRWDGERTLSNVEVLKSRRWWAPTLYGLAGSLYDAEVTHAGIAHHKCVEGGIRPPYPSRGELYLHALWPWAAISGLGFLFTKAKIPWPIYAAMQGANAGFHIHEGSEWITSCW